MRVRKLTCGLLTLLLASAAVGCQGLSGEGKKEYGFSFREISEEAGITFVHEKAQFDRKVDNIMPWLVSTGAGVAVGDYNGDGWMDLYFVNSRKGSKNALFQNNGDGTFTDVADQLGLADINHDGISETAVWFDFDNSGYPSLFVGAWGRSKLFKNNGDGTFTDITDQAGVGYKGYVSKAITLDYNRDGYLDLYLGNYFHERNDLWNLTTTKIMHDDFERARNGGPNVLYRNNGDGTFTDVSKELNVDDTGWTLATGSADINNDGWPDIYNANDFGPDVLYLNQEGKGFTTVVQHAGIGDDTFKGMNVDFADLFHDGNLAFYISNVSKRRYILEGNQLWHQDANGTFVDRAEKLGINIAGFSWGAKFFDADNSGNFSLMVTNGFISASKERDYWFDLGTLATTPGDVIEDARNWPTFGDKSLSGYEQKHLFYNDGSGGTFPDIAQDVGITFLEDSRGVAAVDLFNRGVLDLVFANQGGAARVYRNEPKTGNNWIKLKLEGTTPSNRDAVGTRVIFEVNGIRTIMERDGGNSHGAQSDPRLHFGLGTAEKVDKLTIRWPSGRVEEFHNVPANQVLELKEKAAPITTSKQ
ncbi:MAG: CRTAC1 family protein [Brevibacillus sp.]|nr:CRTAC1 family protein [Brevibacillus sp.]